MAVDILDVVTALGQIAADTYDGSHVERFRQEQASEVGLRREEGDPIVDSRVVDGFRVRFNGNIMFLSYQSPILLADFHESTFEEEVNEYLTKIIKFLKKEYKGKTGDPLTLKPLHDPTVIVQETTRVRCWVEARCAYEIGGTDYEGEDPDEAGGARLETFMDTWDKFNKGTSK